MDTVIKVKGITRRWFLNVVLSMAAGVLAAEIAFGFFIYSYYCNLARSTADTYARFFTGLSYSTAENFEHTAREYTEEFEHSELMQVQIIDAFGNIVADTSGNTENLSKIPDYELALSSPSGVGSYTGKSHTGEQIMAETFILSDVGYGSNGAVRWTISMEPVINKIIFSMVLALLLGGALVVLVSVSGRYFNRSIVLPVQEVSRTARKIAMGDFGARLEVKESDEIGELCDTINYMANELNNAENMKNEFISSVSHELRTPLTAIKGWGETSKMAVESNDKELITKGLSVILGEAERLQSLVEELLDFSRIQSGRLSVNTAPLEIASIIDEAAEMYDELARQHNIILKIARPKALPSVLGDRDRLKQVFINTIDNAVKYTIKDGIVDIKVEVEEGFIRILIRDTGVGIPQKDIDRVKEKFYKANKTIRGSGIGLAVADEIIKQHNGLLFLESEENIGTTVTVVLPEYVEEPEEEAEDVVELMEISEERK